MTNTPSPTDEELIDELLSLKPFLEAHHCRTDAIDRAVSRLSDRAKLEERVLELETVIAPFAAHANIIDADELNDMDEPDFDGWSLLAKDFRRARAALNRSTDRAT